MIVDDIQEHGREEKIPYPPLGLRLCGYCCSIRGVYPITPEDFIYQSFVGNKTSCVILDDG